MDRAGTRRRLSGRRIAAIAAILGAAEKSVDGLRRASPSVLGIPSASSKKVAQKNKADRKTGAEDK